MQDKITHPAWRAWLSQLAVVAQAVGSGGTTAQRPVGTPTVPLFLYQPFFDTTLGKPIWIKTLNPTVWVDATGTPV
jgi:hypothetical protein